VQCINHAAKFHNAEKPGAGVNLSGAWFMGFGGAKRPGLAYRVGRITR
jgi:hypothetical protein